MESFTKLILILVVWNCLHSLSNSIVGWSSRINHKFFKAYKGKNDYGACCLINPYLNLINPETRFVNAADIENKLYHQIPKGVSSGINNEWMNEWIYLWSLK